MEIGPTLIANGEAAKAIEPRQGALDHPAMPSQPFPRLDPPAGDARRNAALAAGDATARIVVAFVSMQFGGTSTRSAPSAVWLLDRRDRIQDRLEHARVMDIGRRERHREGDPAAVDHKMALRARFAAVRRIRSGRFAPLLAGTLAASNAARDQSSLSASARRCKSSRCRRSHTPARCQSRSRRQHVIPLPHTPSSPVPAAAVPSQSRS